MEHGIQDKLWALAENIARTVETPEHQKAREKAAHAAAEALAGTDGNSAEVDSTQELPILQKAAVGEIEVQSDGVGQEERMVLEPGKELDEVAAKCVGAISLMLRSPEVASTLAIPGHYHGLSILLELAMVTQGR